MVVIRIHSDLQMENNISRLRQLQRNDAVVIKNCIIVNFLGISNKIGELTINNCTISSLEGIESFSNLSMLNLSNNNLRDIQLISELKQIQILNLQDIIGQYPLRLCAT
ncbi:Leucine-rich_repeat domain superfamily [Hexamita inflata]|uniref:Leucine-rich repeat domain superfamily n=1 Tax=Hexamita inflata TaxID=28002 RepID=A0AA86VTQ5_9EUKA|nr:Leucine-rich repeat domain superfamily [Hexamita inflata]